MPDEPDVAKRAEAFGYIQQGDLGLVRSVHNGWVDDGILSKLPALHGDILTLNF
jgi:hypothetical protein